MVYAGNGPINRNLYLYGVSIVTVPGTIMPIAPPMGDINYTVLTQKVAGVGIGATQVAVITSKATNQFTATATVTSTNATYDFYIVRQT